MQTNSFEKKYSNLITLKDFFKDVDNYVVLRLSDCFPDYFDYSDIDILCRNSEDILAHILSVGGAYEKQGFQIKVCREKEYLHVDFYPPGAQKLNFRFDLQDCLSYEKFLINPQYSHVVLENRQRISRDGVDIYVPSLENDLAIRFLEYLEHKDSRPSKVKHLEYIKKINNFDFVNVVNRYTNLNISVDVSNGKTNLNITAKTQQLPKEQENRKNAVIVKDVVFRDIRRTKCGTNSVGFNDEYVIKIEHQPNHRKLRNIIQEAEIIRYLNSRGCVSCPKLHSVGTLPSGEHYLILQRVYQKGVPDIADMFFALLEQKNLGVYQGDFKPENMIFDGSLCRLIDYDQAQRNDHFRQMGNVEFIKWIAEDFRERRGHDFFSDPQRNFNKEEIYSLFVNDSFNMKHATVFNRQVTTNTKCGIYHNLDHPKVFIEGARGLDYRLNALDKVKFEKDEKVLDVGCNMGLLSHYLCDRGCEVTGIDMDNDIVLAAKMVANIMDRKINFQCVDMDKNQPTEFFDTICLFSVLHHIQKLDTAIEYIATHCNRIILESRLVESGSKPIDGKWIPTHNWHFKTLREMNSAMEKLFTGFCFEGNYGQVDRNRYILSFVNQSSRKINLNVSRQELADSNAAKKKRLDYFLIWGNGLQYTRQIMDIIRRHKDLEIIYITKKSVSDIGKFVQDIYACDTVPFKHLIAKTRYLLRTRPEIIFMLVKNNKAQEKLFGQGQFRHIQCQLIKDVKEEIRNKFNPRVNGKRTEEHVIHASDYESQVEHVLKVFGLPPIEFYTRQPNPDLDVPYHITPFDDYLIKEVDIDNLYANILGAGVVPITETPHYKYLTGDRSTYQTYYERYFGKQLTEDHFPDAYDLMLAIFKYDFTTKDGRRSLILAKMLDNNKYQILDGVHRAAILKHQGIKTITIAEPAQKSKQQVAKQNLVGLIFSKDRAMQLQATLESFLLHCQDEDSMDLVVLYKASNELHGGQYTELKRKFSGIDFVEESNFREQVLSAIEKCDYILFLVDDNIFVKPFSMKDMTSALQREKEALGFSLRLGRNTNYCYPSSSQQALPQFMKFSKGILKYYWPDAECDFGYPLEVSSSVYRCRDMRQLLNRGEFVNPNTLESLMSQNRNLYHSSPYLLTYEKSVTFSNPVNVVQNVYDNKHGTNNNYTSEELADCFSQGMEVDVEKYTGFIPNAPHQEAKLYFKKTGDNVVRISVIVPCYNHAHYLPEAVTSIVNQTYKHWECIITNDGSSDNTAEVAKRLIAKYPDRDIRFIDKPNNSGLSDTRNVGIEAATSEWILPLDSDDMFERTFMQKAVDIIQQEKKVDIIFANMQEFGASNGEWIPAEYSQQQLMIENVMPYSCLYRKELWRKVGGYDNLLSVIVQPEDWNFWLSCSKHNTVVKRIPENLFLYRVDPNSMYHKTIKDNRKLAWAFIATCHPNLYPAAALLEAWKVIMKCPDEVYDKMVVAADKYPHRSLPFFWQGLMYERDGRIDEAINVYQVASERAAEGDWQSLARLAVLYQDKGETARARSNLEKILTIRPDFGWAKDMLPDAARQSRSTESQTGRQKILFYFDRIGNLNETSPAGTVIAILNFARALQSSNPDVEIHITGDLVHYPEQYESFRVIPLSPPEQREQFLVDYDVVFFATHIRYFKGLAKHSGQIWVLWQHCWEANDRVSLSHISDFDIVICLSELHRASLRDQSIGDEKLITIPNLIDTDVYSSKALSRNNHSIMFAGGLNPHKCVHILLDAFRLVRQQVKVWK